MQPGLFGSVPSSTQRQVVNRQRDEAMRRVAEHAEERRRRFLVDAKAFVVAYLKEHGATSGEVLTNACKAAGIAAHDDRSYGPVYMSLARAGVIEKCGSVRREKGNGTSGGNLWRCGDL